MRVPLQSGWQGGEAWVEVEADELALDDDQQGTGLMITIHTPLELGGYPAELEIGTMRLELKTPAAMLRCVVAASEQQARDLARAILDELDGTG